jgi:hypothetical protein
MMAQFQVRKDDFLTQRLVPLGADATHSPLAPGQIRLAVNSFSFTANNITYAAAGDLLGYWQFYPPVGEDSAGWGVIPVWGFATVVASCCDQITVGERLFGYFPPATQVVMQPAQITEHRLMEGSAHRAELPPAVALTSLHNLPLVKQLAQRLEENLNYTIRVGLTHWDESQGDTGLDNAKSEFFFVPTYIQKRMQDWGPQGFSERSERFLHASAAWSRNWLTSLQ